MVLRMCGELPTLNIIRIGVGWGWGGWSGLGWRGVKWGEVGGGWVGVGWGELPTLKTNGVKVVW